eukprot:TRINITY_DN7617_c0_g2_i1.p1 TRINITY_DN7617_c0_g2~~TRINITY_DN7617_c0_g2_i1.p1  ORF type:complete len:435 (-),score=86.25 TRINITY_DN7617_c0_g2_i1:1280-2584(-)
MAADLVTILRGTTTTHYTVCGKRLGQRAGASFVRFDGMTAAVFPVRCESLTGDTVFALKVMLNYYDDTYTKISLRFQCEYSALECLPPNPFIVPKYAHFTGSASKLGIMESQEALDRTLFIVMELGTRSLKALLEERQAEAKPLSLGEVCEILEAVLQGVALLQKHKIANCDIKSDNVMQMSDGRWVLIDFGECKNWNDGMMGKVADFTAIYYPQMPRGGTPTRMAPEIYHAALHTTITYAKYDLFSVGCLLYNLCGMESPFDDERFRKATRYDDGELPRLPAQYASLMPVLCGLLRADPKARLDAEPAIEMLQQVKRYFAVEQALDVLYGRNHIVQDWRRGIELLRLLADERAALIVGLWDYQESGSKSDRALQFVQRCKHPVASVLCALREQHGLATASLALQNSLSAIKKIRLLCLHRQSVSIMAMASGVT